MIRAQFTLRFVWLKQLLEAARGQTVQISPSIEYKSYWENIHLEGNVISNSDVSIIISRLFRNKWVSELVYLTSLLNSQGLMSDGPGTGQWDEGWKCPRLEYTGVLSRYPVVWSGVFYRSTKRRAPPFRNEHQKHRSFYGQGYRYS